MRDCLIGRLRTFSGAVDNGANIRDGEAVGGSQLFNLMRAVWCRLSDGLGLGGGYRVPIRLGRCDLHRYLLFGETEMFRHLYVGPSRCSHVFERFDLFRSATDLEVVDCVICRIVVYVLDCLTVLEIEECCGYEVGYQLLGSDVSPHDGDEQSSVTVLRACEHSSFLDRSDLACFGRFVTGAV